MKNYTLLAASFLVVCVIAAAVFLDFTKHDINISISETKEKLTLSASFPDKDSEKVQDYLKAQLKMNDLSDFKHLEVRNYQTSDHQMHISIKSHDGYFKIVLDKIKNTSASYHKLKKTAEGLNKVLTQR